MHGELNTNPSLLGLRKVDEINEGKLVICGAAKSHGLVILGIIFVPESVWIQSEKFLLEASELVLSHVTMEFSSDWKIQKINEEEGPFSHATELQLFVLIVNKFDKPFSVVFFECVIWEILGNLPWVLDAIVAKQVHSVSMRPDLAIPNLEVALIELSFFDVLSFTVPCLVEGLWQVLEVFRNLSRFA